MMQKKGTHEITLGFGFLYTITGICFRRVCVQFWSYFHVLYIPRASEAGSPTNRLGSGQRRDTDQGRFSPSIGGLDLDEVYILTDYLKFKNMGQH